MPRTNIDRMPSEDHLVFNDQLPVGAKLDVWTVYSHPGNAGTCVVGIFTSRLAAEAHKEWCVQNDLNNSRFWIHHTETKPHVRDTWTGISEGSLRCRLGEWTGISEGSLRLRLNSLVTQIHQVLDEFTVGEMTRTMEDHPELTCIAKSQGDLTAYTADGALDHLGEYADKPPQRVLDLIALLDDYDLDYYVRSTRAMKIIRDTGGSLVTITYY